MTRPRMATAAAARLRRALRAGVMLIALATAGACELDLDNPNAPTEQEVLSSIDGVIALAVGMQDQYAASVEDYLVPNSLLTDEWGTRTRSLISYQVLVTGPPSSIDPGFGVVEAPFSSSYRVIRSANTLLSGVGNVGAGAGLQAGITSLAHLFKGMAYGQLYLNYEEAPIDVSVEAPLPEPRSAVLATAISLLEEARSDIASVPDADLAGFRSRVLGDGIDLRNTIDALLARYYLFDGDYANAIAAADRVDPSVLSSLAYPTPDRNPIENLAFQLQYVFALESFVDEAEPGDDRPAFWVQVDEDPIVGNPDSLLLPLNEYSSGDAPYPLYLPDEMKLIKAEALTRQGDFAEAAALVNAVRTDAAPSALEPAAGLAALAAGDLDTEDELLDQIAYERRYELYEQGLRWEDTRRLGTDRTVEPVIEFLPYPQQECDANPANPCG